MSAFLPRLAMKKAHIKNVKAYLLLVTWFTTSGAHSYQLTFDSLQKCTNAITEITRNNTMVIANPGIKVSVVCVEK